MTRALQIDDGATFDVGDGALIQDYTAGDVSPLAVTRYLILTGGLVSGGADSSHALGYGEAADVLSLSGAATGPFAGRTVDATSVLVRFTLKGDANLNGAVDFEDLVRLAQSYNTTVSSATDSWWARGDFTMDGVVDFGDLVALAQNYNNSLPAGALDPSFAEAWAAAQAVPEPAALSLLMWSAIALRGRSRRARSRQRRPGSLTFT